MFNLRHTLGCLVFCLLAGGRTQAQPLYFNTSSSLLASRRAPSTTSLHTSPLSSPSLLPAPSRTFGAAGPHSPANTRSYSSAEYTESAAAYISLTDACDGDGDGDGGSGFTEAERALTQLRSFCGRSGGGKAASRVPSSLETACAEHDEERKWQPIGAGSTQYRHHRVNK